MTLCYNAAMQFTTETLQQIIPVLKEELQHNDTLSFDVLNPDLFAGNYAGTQVRVEGRNYLHRSLRAWMELAEILKCRMHLPRESTYPLVTLTFSKLEEGSSFHLYDAETKEEKYGVTSDFFAIHKMEEPAFFHYYLQALENVGIEDRKRVLNLGINRGDEFETIKALLDIRKYENMEFVGIDHSETAIEYAQGRFEEENVMLHAADINHLDRLNLGKFDLLISIGTLQSPGIDYKPFLMHLVQHYLSDDAALILGFPNSRWIGGEMVYGAKAPNYAMNEMSLVLNDIIFAKKYLQQKRFRVTVTGKQYLFLTATKIIRKK